MSPVALLMSIATGLATFSMVAAIIVVTVITSTAWLPMFLGLKPSV